MHAAWVYLVTPLLVCVWDLGCSAENAILTFIPEMKCRSLLPSARLLSADISGHAYIFVVTRTYSHIPAVLFQKAGDPRTACYRCVSCVVVTDEACELMLIILRCYCVVETQALVRANCAQVVVCSLL